MHVAGTRGRMTTEETLVWQTALAGLPALVQECLTLEPKVVEVAQGLQLSRSCLFLGRGLDYPTALEGALKLKEISYIHAEGYAAGEMKHGPIALIDPDMSVIAIATDSAIREKVVSNVEEALARGAKVTALVTKGDTALEGKAQFILELPKVAEFLSPIINAIPLQLLAYHVARLKGCDVDQPRNLAKSVTVE
jgi:glucosamine--fructose-6-phosphate aminotransferase (isomerizing)